MTLSKEAEFSPRAFLKARRPERFSDSVVISRPAIERASLEYHLEVLTSKKQETAFEDFARRLAQREICPNLLPQTGPTGGGDSKVDSETYPVSDALAWRWYVGIGREASRERWAFAFSAKKQWRSKLRKDIASIAGTGRGYKKAIFVTNQFVRDKDRASLEDELSKQHGMDVRILDRTWILNTVFEQGHEDLAVEYLGVGELKSAPARGPKDTERELRLQEAEQRIRNALESGDSTSTGLVDDAIVALELSRELELPETELRGRMARAMAVSERFGTTQQRIEARYQAAWTVFWWLERPEEVAPLYDELERAVAGTINAHNLELLTNLWFLQKGAADRGNVDASALDLDGKAERLLNELDRLAADETRPSASLQARTLKLHVTLSRQAQDPKVKEAVVTGLTDVINGCAGLVGYPLEPLVSLLLEVGEILEDVPGYDTLFDILTDTWATRKGEIEAARLLLVRGAKQLDNRRPLDAVASIGKALTRLYKHESRQELVQALFLAGVAYRRIGLLWASRGTHLCAASTATSELWTYGDITNAQLACYDALRWSELELGRLPQALCWHEAALACAHALGLTEGSTPTLAERNLRFDAVLGMLFFRLDVNSLSNIERLPDALDRIGLVNAAVALQWTLGEAHLPKEFVDSLSVQDPEKYFSMWAGQPAASELPAKVELGLERRTELQSWVLGCNVRVSAVGAPPSLELAESFLGALEALLATGPLHNVIAREPLLMVEISQSEYTDSPFSFKVNEELGQPRIEVFVRPFDASRMPLALQSEIKAKLLDLVITAVARTVHAADLDTWLSEIFGGEEAVARAIHFTSAFVTASNVLGDDPPRSIRRWQADQDHTYRVLRAQPWEPLPVEFPTAEEDAAPADEEEAEFSLRDPNRLTHRQMRTHSLIREQLWNEAGWSGTVFVWTPEGAEPPLMAPVFRNARAAQEIFKGWQKEIGSVDEDERLRVSIIRGVNAAHPAWYRISIGSDPHSEHRSAPPSSVFVTVLRHHEMNASSTKNLDGFLGRYVEVGSYILAPALLVPGEEQPRLATKLGIRKTRLLVRSAWEIGRHDLDSVTFKPDDEPVLPTDGRPTPVTELLGWIGAQTSRK